MKVLDVTEFYSQRGGGVRSHLTLKSHILCQWGHDHVVVAPGPVDDTTVLPPPPPSSQTASRPQGVAKVVRIGGRALPYDPTYHLLFRLDKVRAIVSRERPQVLEINSPYAAAAAALSCPRPWFGVRTFMWHADFIDTYLRVMLEERVPSRAADVVLEPLWSLVRRIGRGSDATICGARWQVDKLRAHGVPRVVHIPFGVDKSTFHPGARDEALRRELLASFGEPPPDDARLVVAIGRFAWEKRWDVVLEAFERLAAKVPARLVCFGDGPERKAIEAKAAGRNDVRFRGFVTDRGDLARTLASADLLLHGCPFETFGLGVAEAVASGCPVVVPDEGGAAELAFGEAAVTYAATNAEACAEAAIAMLQRDPSRVREAALAAGARVLSVEEQFGRTVSLYDELLSKVTRASAPEARA